MTNFRSRGRRRFRTAAVMTLAAMTVSATAASAAWGAESNTASASSFRLRDIMRPVSQLLLNSRISLVALTCPFVEAAYADATPTANNVGNLEQATVCLVNDLRTQNGLQALTVDARITNSARNHSQDMVNQKRFTHDRLGNDPDPSAFGYGWTGENIAWGSGSFATPRNIVEGPDCGWFTEPHTSGPCTSTTTGHRDNILNGHFTHTGVGVALGGPSEANYPGSATYTQDFGGPSSG